MARKLDRSGNRERLHSDDGEPPPERPRSGLTRRSYIKLGATTVAALSVTTAANDSIRRHGIAFDRVLDAVDDLGVDPTGGTAADEQILAAGDGTLVQFPDGRYQFDGGLGFDGGRRGFEAVGETVSVHPADDRTGFLLDADRMDDVYFDGIDLDQRQSAVSAGIRLRGDRVVVQNVDVLGGPGGGGRPLVAHATLSRDGYSLFRNLTATTGGGRPPLGRPGIFVESDHAGTVSVRDCDLRRFPDGAVHAARRSGRVQVAGSHFENNAVSIRLCGGGSSVENCSIVVEELPPVERSDGTDSYRLHGISVASAAGTADAGSPVWISDSTVRIEQLPAAVPAIVSQSVTPLVLADATIEYNNQSDAVVLGRRPGQTDGRSPIGPVRIRETTVTGSGAVDSVVELANADRSELEQSRIQMPNSDTDGISLRDSAGCRIERTRLAVPGQAAVLTDSTVEALALVGADRTDTASTPSSPGTDTLVIEGSETETAYEFTVDGRIQSESEPSGYPASGRNAEGVICDGADRYTIDGRLTDLRLDGTGVVSLNGRRIDPKQFGAGYPHELVFDPDGSATDYAFSVTALSPWATPTPGNRVDASRSTTVDRYRFDGTVDALSVRGTATLSFGTRGRE